MVQTRAITEDFDLYPATTNQAGYGVQATWIPTDGNAANSMSMQTGRFGGQCLRLNNAGAGGARRVYTPGTEAAFGFAFRNNNGSGVASPIAILYSSNGNAQWSIGHSALDQLGWGLGTAINTRMSATSNLPRTVWHYLDIEYGLSDSTGWVDIYLNGISVAELALPTGDSKGHADADIGIVGLWTAGGSHDFDDFYFEIGGHARVGEGRHQLLVPTSDVSAGGFTPSTGATLFGVLDEVPANATDYVSATAAGSEFRLGLADLGVVPETIYGVQIVSLDQKDEAGTRTTRNKLWSGTAEFDGATVASTLNSSTFKRDWLPLNPGGNVVWDAAAVNAAEIGKEIVV